MGTTAGGVVLIVVAASPGLEGAYGPVLPMLLGTLGLFGIGLAFARLALSAVATMRDIRDEWLVVAERLDEAPPADAVLPESPPGHLGPLALEGALDGRAVRIRTEPQLVQITETNGRRRRIYRRRRPSPGMPDDPARIWTVLEMQLTGLDPDVVVAPDGLKVWAGRGTSAKAWSGDPSFDTRVVARGDAPTVLSHLDARTRRVLTGGRVLLRNGRVELWHPTFVTSAGPLSACLDELAATVDALKRPVEPRDRLGAIAVADPVIETRARALRYLRAHWPDAPETHAAIESARGSGHAILELTVVDASTPEARRDLVRTIRDPASSYRVRALALGVLADHAPDAAIEIAADVLGHATRDLLDEAIAVATIHRDARLAAALRDRLGGRVLRDPAPAMRALAAYADPADEAHWIALLRTPDDRIAGEATRILTRMGTLAAVEPLRERARGETNAELARAIERAIARILAASEAGERGGLALVDTADEGRLAVMP